MWCAGLPAHFVNLPRSRVRLGEAGANKPMPQREGTGVGLLGKLARRGVGLTAGECFKFISVRAVAGHDGTQGRSGKGQAAFVLVAVASIDGQCPAQYALECRFFDSGSNPGTQVGQTRTCVRGQNQPCTLSS